MPDARSPAAGDREAAARLPTDWSRPTFTAHLRGAPPLSLVAHEERLVHESSIAFRATRAVARVPGLRRALGAVPPRIGGGDASVAATGNEALLHSKLYRRLTGVRRTALYRRLWIGGLRGIVRRGAPVPEVRAAATAADAPAAAPARPQLGEWTSRQVDEAIEMLRGVPFEELQRRGWHFQPNHFYWPLNDVDFLRANHELWHDRGLPRDIDWDLDRQVEVARTIDGYRHELDDVPWTPQEGRTEYIWNNGAFGGADAVAYYGLVRDLQPRRVVEVGSGWSSLLLKRALARNETPCDVTLVEPFPNEELFAALPSDWEVHRAVIQHADFAVFERLQAGDVCFYDGSHCVRTAGDVNWFFFEVLPRLAPGVYVHVHDIFFPDDYHDSWVYDEGLSWNEQYLVQAFLMNNDAYRVHLANHLLYVERNDELAPLYASDGGSLWLEKLR
jgi:hypothetical protein